MLRTAAVVGLALLVGACSSFSPVPIVAGDVCETCKKQIREVKFAGEVITTQGVVLKFRTPECLANYSRAHPETIGAKFVTDYQTGRFIRPENATYVRTVLDENTREMTHAAFANFSEAVKFGKDRVSSPVDWLMMLNSVANQKTN
jgi:hypothetical protein